MRKPVLIFRFGEGQPTKDERQRLAELIKTPELTKDYHVFISFDNSGANKIELLQKGRRTKSIINKLKKLPV